MTLLPALLLAALALPTTGARQASASEELTLEGRIARDARLSFRRASADRARAILDDAPTDELERAVAVMALGASRSARDLFRMESLAYEGKPTERRGAILALGELGEIGCASLERLLAGDTVGVEEALVVALIHAAERGSTRCGEHARGLQLGEGPLARAALELSAYTEGGPPPPVNATLDLYYDLRWRAARGYGFVDGRRWRSLLLSELCTDEDFLDRVILQAAGELPSPAVQDHLFEILNSERRTGALRALATLLPAELADVITSGAWRPPGLDDWRVLLNQIDDRKVEREAVPLLRLAFETNVELQEQAGLLLLRAGEEVPWKWVATKLATATPEKRQAFIEAAGDRNDPALVPDLVALVFARPELGILGAGLVALTRLDYPDAKAELERLLGAGRSEERRQVLLSLSRSMHDRRMLPYVERALRLEDLEPEVHFRLELGIALEGRLNDKQVLRSWLRDSDRHPLRRLVVRALAQRPDEEDLVLLRSLFPDETDRALNIELALALLKNRDGGALPLLRAALWNDAWNRSVLAGGLLAENVSLFALIDELDAPPPTARTIDVRRVGFAIGEWGGLGAVETLARRRGESDEALQGAFLGALATRTH